jgi:hypothetical protein
VRGEIGCAVGYGVQRDRVGEMCGDRWVVRRDRVCLGMIGCAVGEMGCAEG